MKLSELEIWKNIFFSPRVLTQGRWERDDGGGRGLDEKGTGNVEKYDHHRDVFFKNMIVVLQSIQFLKLQTLHVTKKTKIKGENLSNR